MADAQVFGPPRARDNRIEAIESLWLETKTKYRKKKNKTAADTATFRQAKDEFLAARQAWRVKADKERA